MSRRSRGIRSKSRNILKKKKDERGKIPISRTLQKFNIGDNVSVDIDPSVHKGMPHIRFQGYTGKIQGKQGNSYVVKIRVGKKYKTLVVRPEHLKGVM